MSGGATVITAWLLGASALLAAAADTAEIVARSSDTDDAFAIKALGVKPAVPKGGQPASVTFVAQRADRYPIECLERCGSGHPAVSCGSATASIE